MNEPRTPSDVACLHRRTRRAVVRNPMEKWSDCVCRDCRRRVHWPETLRQRRAELVAELATLDAEMAARDVAP